MCRKNEIEKNVQPIWILTLSLVTWDVNTDRSPPPRRLDTKRFFAAFDSFQRPSCMHFCCLRAHFLNSRKQRFFFRSIFYQTPYQNDSIKAILQFMLWSVVTETFFNHYYTVGWESKKLTWLFEKKLLRLLWKQWRK